MGPSAQQVSTPSCIPLCGKQWGLALLFEGFPPVLMLAKHKWKQLSTNRKEKKKKKKRELGFTLVLD